MMYRPQYLEEPESTYEKYWSHNGYLPVQHTRIILWSGYKRKQNHEVVPFRGRRKPKTPKVGHRGDYLWP
ncbi:hypothetical protein [Bacteriophage sp.]|nr:hypothetical protein [Bacteriophage sp.]